MINLGGHVFDCGEKKMNQQAQDNSVKTTADMEYNMSHSLAYTSQVLCSQTAGADRAKIKLIAFSFGNHHECH